MNVTLSTCKEHTKEVRGYTPGTESALITVCKTVLLDITANDIDISEYLKFDPSKQQKRPNENRIDIHDSSEDQAPLKESSFLQLKSKKDTEIKNVENKKPADDINRAIRTYDDHDVQSNDLQNLKNDNDPAASELFKSILKKCEEDLVENPDNKPAKDCIDHLKSVGSKNFSISDLIW